MERFPGYVAIMDWQQSVSLVIVGTTAAALLWGRFRRRKFSFERDTHCGCAVGRKAFLPPSIVFHARKGERSQVFVKMK
jgi:hypothetical protein